MIASFILLFQINNNNKKKGNIKCVQFFKVLNYLLVKRLQQLTIKLIKLGKLRFR